MKKIGLALGAGGARGFCHIGVIEVLLENKIPINVVTGCSMGAMVGGGLVSGVSVDKMREIACEITNFKVFDLDLFGIKRRGGFAKGNRAMKIYAKHVEDKNIEDCDIKFAATATDLMSHQLYTFTSGSLLGAIRASIAIPGVFHPVTCDDKLFVDGGVLERIPIQAARDLGADIVIAIDALGPPRRQNPKSALGVVDLSYQVMDWKTAQSEIKKADILITPDMGTRSSFRFRDNQDTIQAGRDAAIKMLPEIWAKLVDTKSV